MFTSVLMKMVAIGLEEKRSTAYAKDFTCNLILFCQGFDIVHI